VYQNSNTNVKSILLIKLTGTKLKLALDLSKFSKTKSNQWSSYTTLSQKIRPWYPKFSISHVVLFVS
jgi:hypothetical protein